MTRNLSLISILIFAISLTPSLASKIQSRNQEHLNKAFDESLQSAIEMFDDRLSPYKVPDMVLNFSRRVAFINWGGELKLTNIELSQLQSVQRTSDLKVCDAHDVNPNYGLVTSGMKAVGAVASGISSLLPSFGSNRDKVSDNVNVCRVSTNLTFERVFYTAEFGIKLLMVGVHRHLEGWTDDINVEATISYDKKIDLLSLDKLTIHSMKEPRLKVHGRGIVMDSLSNFLIQSGVKVFKRTHKFLLQKIVKSLLGKKIPDSEILKEVLAKVC